MYRTGVCEKKQRSTLVLKRRAHGLLGISVFHPPPLTPTSMLSISGNGIGSGLRKKQSFPFHAGMAITTNIEFGGQGGR